MSKSESKFYENLFGWCVIGGAGTAIFLLINGDFIAAGFVFTFAWWSFYKMQNYKHDQVDTPIMCSMVGHKPPVYNEHGWWSPGEEYATLRVGQTDGIGRVHGKIFCGCARCGQEFMIARVHVPTIEVEKKE